MDFSEPQYERLEFEAEKRGLSISELVRRFVDQGLDACGTGWAEPEEYQALEPERARRSVPGFVYLFRNLNRLEFYKIGFSVHPSRRLEEVSKDVGAPLELICSVPCQDMRALETELHERFQLYRLRPREEWFQLPPDGVEFILRLSRQES